MRNCNTFDAQIHHRQTQIHKTQHGPDLGKPSPSPLYYSLCLAMGLAPKCYFVPGLPNGSFEILKIGTIATLAAYNFV